MGLLARYRRRYGPQAATLVTLLINAVSQGPAVVEPEPEPLTVQDGWRWAVDVVALKASYNDTGSFALPLANGTTVTVEAMNRSAPWAAVWYAMPPDGARGDATAHNDTTLAVEGSVVGSPDSAVRLMLGDAGVYGTIRVGNQTHEYDTRSLLQPGRPSPTPPATGREVVQYVYSYNDTSEPWAPQPIGFDTPPVTSDVVYDAEPTYRYWTGAAWKDRILSAVDRYAASIEAQGNIRLNATVWALGQNVLATDACTGDSVVDQYRAQLVRDPHPEADAYQLWTSRDLQGADDTYGYLCFGLADADTVGATVPAASVVEGFDNNCCDAYDADQAHQRAVVSAHELVHLYGEECHRTTGVRHEARYNLFEEGHDRRANGFWWDPGSVDEVAARLAGEEAVPDPVPCL